MNDFVLCDILLFSCQNRPFPPETAQPWLNEVTYLKFSVGLIDIFISSIFMNEEHTAQHNADG